MKKIALTLFFAIVVTIPCIGGITKTHATTIDVYQDDIYLGSIDAYTGTETAFQNYSAAVVPALGEPYHGPLSVETERQIYFYEQLSSDGESLGLYFFAHFGSLTLTGHDGNSTDWDIYVENNLSDTDIIFSNDSGEVVETSDDVFEARWYYYITGTDGVVLGDLSGDDWTITIDAIYYSDLMNSLYVYSETGEKIELDLDLSSDITFKISSTTNPVPEPSTMVLLGMGFLGFAKILRKKSSSKKVS